jgi:hypothetical protein
MTIFKDCFGRDVRLTDERLTHILEHPEMRDMDRHLGETLARPSIVRKSRSDLTDRPKEGEELWPTR